MMSGLHPPVYLIAFVMSYVLPLLAGAQDLEVVTVQPTANSLTASANDAIVIQFDRAIKRSSVTGSENIWAFGRWSGNSFGTYGFSAGDTTVTLTPGRPFSAGEMVTVYVANEVMDTLDVPLRPGGYSFQFWVRAARTDLTFSLVDQMTTRDPSDETTRPYGGTAGDLDADGYLDLMIVNEVSDDVRVFMNTDDGSGLFDAVLFPTNATGISPSPSEASDFNKDGHTDVCTADVAGGTVSVFLGNGDGTFGARQSIGVGQNVKGIGVLDADGDGDIDIVNTNNLDSNVSLLLNDGSGVFGAPTYFDAGSDGEWGLGVADFSNDGLLDIAVGFRSDNKAGVLLNDGDGTFTAQTSVACGDGPWQVAVGDINGDANMDVAVANRDGDGSGGILLGDGTGLLGSLSLLDVPESERPVAIDLGDLDGDADLDCIVSAVLGTWHVFSNDGSGAFVEDHEIVPTQSASCSLMLDINNDSSLDLALIDELEDEVLIMKSAAIVPTDIWVDFGHAGEEIGTSALPFDTLAEALVTIASGGTINLSSGASTEALVVNQAVTLMAISGPVQIGAAAARFAAPPWRPEGFVSHNSR